jgi:Ca2+-binding EF-hand superfamily protein
MAAEYPELAGLSLTTSKALLSPHETFNKILAPGKTTLSKGDIKAAFRVNGGAGLSPKGLRKLIEVADTNGNQKISMHEWEKLYELFGLRKQVTQLREELRKSWVEQGLSLTASKQGFDPKQAFESMKQSGMSHLTKADLRAGLLIPGQGSLDNKQIDELMHLADTDNDGVVSLEEFQTFMELLKVRRDIDKLRAETS